jgi:hypothetical protein
LNTADLLEVERIRTEEGRIKGLIQNTVQRIDEYLTVLRLSGNYKERQKIKLTNQQLPAFCDESRRAVLGAVARGVLADAFLKSLEDERPTPGRPLPEQFQAFVAKALEGK